MGGSAACISTSQVQASESASGTSLSKSDRVVVGVAGAAAVFLVPWTVYLGGTLHHPGFWVAIDSMEMVAAGATAVLVARRSMWGPVVARMGSVVLVLDALTDVTSAHHMGRLVAALGMAVVVELPLAVGAWLWAGRRLNRMTGTASVRESTDTHPARR